MNPSIELLAWFLLGLLLIGFLVRHRRTKGAASHGEAIPIVSPGVERPFPQPSRDLSRDEAVIMRDARHEQAQAQMSKPGREDWPPKYVDPFPQFRGRIPEIQAKDFTADILGGATAHHGALIIRGLFSAEQVARTRKMQDKVRAQSLQHVADEGGWYAPFVAKTMFRGRVEALGGNWLADSPQGLNEILAELEIAGVTGAVAAHLGEWPTISLQKTTLRSVEARDGEAGWHQDGNFLREDVRTMNVWVALCRCGGDSPASGLELMAHRFEEVFASDPGLGNAALSAEVMDELKQKYPREIPEFSPGDAIMFDEKFMHKTALSAALTETRYALECWYFAPSHSESTYVPFMA